MDDNSFREVIASVARCYNPDARVQKFIDRKGLCNVVNLGGLETSYCLIDRKNSIFFEVDLPEVIELRHKYLEVGENEKFVAGNMFKLEGGNELDTVFSTIIYL